MSRDPIGESGGLNLYGFVGNDAIGWIDSDGREPQAPSLDINQTWHRPAGTSEGGHIISNAQKPSANITPGNSIVGGNSGNRPATPNEAGSTPANPGAAIVELAILASKTISKALQSQVIDIGLKSCNEQKAESGKSWGCCEIAYQIYYPQPRMKLYFPEGGVFHPCKSCLDVQRDKIEPVKGHVATGRPTNSSAVRLSYDRDYYISICGKAPSEMLGRDLEKCQNRIRALIKNGLLKRHEYFEDM